MATALPSTGMSSRDDAPTCDTDDLKLVHGLLTHLFAGAPALVSAVRPGQPRRRAAVAAHLAMISGMLHGHHRVEDDLLWDDLAARAPRCALHVGLMRRQHAEIGEMLDRLDRDVAGWAGRADSTADDGSVVAAIDGVRRTLGGHLGDEERLVADVATVTMTQKEWDRLGEAGSAHTPKGMMFVQLGYLIDSLPADQRREWVRTNLPAAVRLLWNLSGRRSYRAYLRALEVDA